MVRDDRNPVKTLVEYLGMAVAFYALLILAETFLFPSLFSFVALAFPDYASLSTALISWILCCHVAWTISNLLFLPSWIKDLNKVCGAVEELKQPSPSGATVAILGFFTLQIYFIWWAGTQGGRIFHAGPKYGLLMERNGWFYALMAVLLPPLAVYFLLFDFNYVCKSHNSMVIRGIVPGVQGVGTDPWHYIQNYGSNQEDDTGDGPISIGNPNFGKISFIAGQYAGNEMILQPNEVIYLGRDSNRCQVVFPRMEVSGLHCKIQFIGYPKSTYYITDYSTNGTYLNLSMKLPKGQEVECPIGSRITLAFGSEEFMLK